MHEAEAIASQTELRKRLNDPRWDARHVVLLDRALPLDPAVPGANETVALVHYRADRPAVTAHLASRGLLVFSEMDYPGWKATVDGRRAPIIPVDGALRGIVLPAGDHRVQMRYAPAYWYPVLGLTLLAFLGGGLCVFELRRHPA